jgi:foldase protein PrsA
VIISESGIDREALKATVKKEDFRQYTMQYYKVSNKTGSGEEEVDVTAEQKQTNLNNMKALQEKAKTAEDFTKLLEEKDTTGIQAVQTQELLEKDMDSSSFLTKKLRKRLIKMSNDQISDVIEGEDGYYLVKMVNNDDSAAYDKECDSVVSAEETKQFNAKYAEIKTRYNTEVQSYWKGRVKLGSYTAVQ